jgi:3-oxoadipate enol-lactonase
MPYAAGSGIRLYYEVRGAGPRLLHIGGTGADLRHPRNAFERRLARDFNLLRFDQRGMGRSDKPDFPYTLADYAADAAALLDAVGWERCAVLGYSFGGMVAQELALRHPRRVERLVLMSTTGGGEGGSSYPLHELLSLSDEARARRMVELADVRRDERWRRENAALYDALVAESLAAMRMAQEDPAHAIGTRRQLEARRSHDTWERLPQLRLPVTVLGGSYDGIAPPESQRALARRIPGAGFELFEGGHLFFLQQPGAYSRVRAGLVGEEGERQCLPNR